jgi:hypothetical protein
MSLCYQTRYPSSPFVVSLFTEKAVVSSLENICLVICLRFELARALLASKSNNWESIILIWSRFKSDLLSLYRIFVAWKPNAWRFKGVIFFVHKPGKEEISLSNEKYLTIE